jgi:RNA ligase
MPIETDILKSLCGDKHPAHSIPFDELYKGLMDEVKAGNVNVVTNDTKELELFSYSIGCQFDNNWNMFSLVSRGLILCPSQKKIVATSFPKFFNFGEIDYWIPDEWFEVTEKMDGSLGIVFYWDNDWRVATRGSFQSDQAKWAKKWLDENLAVEEMTVGYTYLTEIIYKENRIVISYQYEGLALLTAYNSIGRELPTGLLMGEEIGFLPIKTFSYKTLDEMLEKAKVLAHDEEGFVVRFANGYRLKIKGDEYIKIHRIISKCTPIAIWNMLLSNLDITEIEKQLPEEIRNDYNLIIDILNKKFEASVAEIKHLYKATLHWSDKELGLSNTKYKSLIFSARKRNLFDEVKIADSPSRKSIFNLFYPKGNELEGYTPLSSMNIFRDS